MKSQKPVDDSLEDFLTARHRLRVQPGVLDMCGKTLQIMRPVQNIRPEA
jgi:hypothetical protein